MKVVLNDSAGVVRDARKMEEKNNNENHLDVKFHRAYSTVEY